MSLTNASTRPAIVSNRINEHDHGAALIVASGIVLAITLMALCLRLFQRWPWSKLLKVEDFLLVGATAFEIANTIVVSRGVTDGLGRKGELLEVRQVSRTRQALIASFALTFVIEGFSATSYVCLLRSMNPARTFQRVMECLCGLVTAWSIAGVARFSASASRAVPEPSLTTWTIFGAVGIAIQLCLMAGAFWTIWGLQMPFGRKAGLSLWFSLPLLVVAITIVRLVQTPQQTLTGDFTWIDTDLVILLVIEGNLTIVNAAYPSVRAFLDKVSTGFIVADTYTGTRSQERSNRKSSSYALQSIRAKAERVAAKGKSVQPPFGDARTATHSTVIHEDGRSDRSFGSEVIMVRRSVEINQISRTQSQDASQ